MESFGRTRRKLYIYGHHNRGYLWLRTKLHDYFVPYGRNKIETRKNKFINTTYALDFSPSPRSYGRAFPLHYGIGDFSHRFSTHRSHLQDVGRRTAQARSEHGDEKPRRLQWARGRRSALRPPFFSRRARSAAVFFAFGLVVAIYGAISSQFSILFKQGTLPFLGLVSLVLL